MPWCQLCELRLLNLIVVFICLIVIFCCKVQGKDPAMDSTQETVDESEEERFEDANDSSSMVVELPPCELGKLEQISEVRSHYQLLIGVLL